MDAIETVKRELKYNSGPAIAYVRVGTSDAQQLVKMAETSLKQADEIAHLKRSLAYIAKRKSDNADWTQAHNALAVYGWPKEAE